MYIRDSWQVTSKLTMNYGVRWEYYPFATADHGGVKLFNPSTGNVLIGGYGSTPLDDGVNVGHGQFLPRVGIAYRLGSNTVIRAGYGMSADSNNWRFFRNNFPATTNSDVLGSSVYYPVGSLTGETLAPYPGLTAGIPLDFYLTHRGHAEAGRLEDTSDISG
jgi:outer membrane receptor protein involved in Fe transport